MINLTNLEIKAELLCKGLSADDETLRIFSEQNPNVVWKTGNNGCFIEYDGTSLLASVAHRYNTASPYHFSMSNGELSKFDEVVRNDVTATIYPKWYTISLSNGRSFTEVFLLEGKRFFHQAYKGCDYMARGCGCAFCSTGLRNSYEVSPFEIGEASDIIKEHVPDAQICLGGGTYLPISDNVRFFADCVREIRKKNGDIPIWIEMVPPSIEDIQYLIDEGATSFGFNMELWDDVKRHDFCPGKSEVPIKHYLNALEYVAKKLPNRAGSCLLVGLDSEESIKDGINALVSVGAHPCLLPFRPFTGSHLEDAEPCHFDVLLELSNYAVEQVYKAGLNLLDNQGCMLCECCTVMHDIWKMNYEEALQ